MYHPDIKLATCLALSECERPCKGEIQVKPQILTPSPEPICVELLIARSLLSAPHASPGLSKCDERRNQKTAGPVASPGLPNL